MSFPLLELPIEIVTTIFEFANDESLLNLAQASKITSRLACPIFLNRNEALDRIEFIEMVGGGKISIRFSFGKDNLRSKFAFLKALKCVQTRLLFVNSEGVHTTMTKSEIVQFFDQMSSKTEGIKSKSLEFEPTPTMISLISKIFKGKSVPELVFKLEDEIFAFNSLMNLIIQLETTSIRVRLGKFYPGYYLGQLATVVDKILISGSVKKDNAVAWNAHDILSRRCCHLDFTNSSLTFESVDLLLLSDMLNEDIGDRPFFFTAMVADNYTSQSGYEKRRFIVNNHVMIKTLNSSDKNTIELRHVNMKHRK
ncbi:hypothetical protein PRIPAC_72485 [Pristionchus pacificus]|uniref:F-box domain-containing protein n=1 Tax=Pristionchus pacificus TaxID=54126 RepID=A0A2A6C1F1_PRIPA|nr:hypothetical protein PRIPAC_72485 [Pristionchus pacificus]|eukprot:PDM71853.1 hypothetical protein PRIPAC_38260 [Pristionchus pacificus]